MKPTDIVINEIAATVTASRARKAIDRSETSALNPSAQSFSGHAPDDGGHPTCGSQRAIAAVTPTRAKSAAQRAKRNAKPINCVPAASISAQAEADASFSNKPMGAMRRPTKRRSAASVDGHSFCEPQHHTAIDATNSDEGPAIVGERGDDQRGDVHQQKSSVSPLILSIQYDWRLRQRWHRAEKSLVLQAKALLRGIENGDKDKANATFDAAFKPFALKRPNGDPAELMIAAVGPERGFALMPMLQSIAYIARQRETIEKRLQERAKELPIYEWTAGIHGFGAMTLASIVGEAGDVGGYKSVSAFWKRMGLAVIGGQRQRKIADAELALEHGYSPQRRAVSYLLGQWLIMAGEKNPYRSVYEDRKAYELPRCEAIAADPELKKKYSRTGKYAPKAHANNRAARYMVKRVLRDLYGAWRRSDIGGQHFGSIHLSSAANVAEFREAAE